MSRPPSGILETALYAPDLDACARFYEEIVGLQRITDVPGRHIFFRCGPGVLLLFQPEETRKPPSNPAMPVPVHGTDGPGHVCFRAAASELDQWRERFAAEGVAIDADFRWPGGARSIYVRDPAGNSVEFAEPRLWGID